MLGRGLSFGGALLLALGLTAVATSGRQVPGRETSAVRTESGSTGLVPWLRNADAGLASVSVLSDADLERTGVGTVLRIYLDAYEPLESWYGTGARYGVAPLAPMVARGEARFHALLQAQHAAEIRSRLAELRATLDTIAELGRSSGVPGWLSVSAVRDGGAARGISAELRAARTAEISAILASLHEAESRWEAGDAAGALSVVEQTYLQQFEPLEARLPGPLSRQVESLIHLRLRPELARASEEADVHATFLSLYASLADADAALAGGTTFWFGAANAFVIIVREGLEAVLLIAAIVAYLTGARAPKRDTRRVFAGAGLGVFATFLTWLGARTILPVSGAGRELMEGVTALVAVGVLLWVSHWLFQKTYIHDWKAYLRSKVGQAATTGSAVAMAGLAFAAVYREGFETVLFYQALLFDSSSAAVLAGFVPGVVLMAVLGIGVLRLGVRLPLRLLFGITNGILLYLAFVFLGKGIYNLQEAGVFAPRPIGWLPDHDVLRELFGFYPLAETILAQIAFLTLIVATGAFYLIRRRMLAVGAAQAPTPD